MKIVIYIGMAVVVVAAFVLSFDSLCHLGVMAGYGGLAWLFPVSVDAGALVTCAAWLHRGSRHAGIMMWTLLVVSVLLNATVHRLDATHTSPSWLLLTLVGATPPGIMGSVVHLGVSLHQQDRGKAKPETLSQAVRPPAPIVLADAEVIEPVAEDDPLLNEAKALAAELGRTPGRPILRERLDISDHQAKRITKALASTNGHGGTDV